MFLILYVIFFFLPFNYSQTIKHLNEISIEEELPIGSTVTLLTDKIPNLDQSIEYDLVKPLSTDLDLFYIDHNQYSLKIKSRVDYEHLYFKKNYSPISVSIAVANQDTIDVYILPIRILNKNDNSIKFLINRTVIEIEENDENWFRKTYSLPKAYDDDQDLITYSIYLQNWNKPDGLFQFDEKNLLLKPLKKFDREENHIYLLRLIAHNQNDVSTDIIILIKDTNDNSPKCQQNQTLFPISNISSISKFILNVTDLDEGDNGNLEYRLINSLPGFMIDRYNGEIKFDYRKWIRSNESILIVNISDHGRPVRLSTKCFIEIKFTFLLNINFQSNVSIINQKEIYMTIKSIDAPLGRFIIHDQQTNKSCFNCLININSSIKDIFYFNHATYDIYLNLNSIVLMKILTNYINNNENISLTIQINVTNPQYSSIISTKQYSLMIHFNKLNLLIRSNIFFLKIYENVLLNESISIFNRYHPCLNNQTKQFVLIDSTDTFTIDKKLNLILRKYLNVKQKTTYRLIVQEKQNNFTNKMTTCSIQLRIYVLNPYSIDNVFPYFSQPFYIILSKNISQFSLPSIPSYVRYVSSIPNLISIDPYNGSIRIRPPLYSSFYYDFQIQAVDSHLPSLSSSVSVRIFFGINKYPPYLLTNPTKQSIGTLSSKFLYEIRAYDPDILLNDETNLFIPSIEYEIETLMNIEIERFTGRIFFKELNETTINFTLIMKDFGQPNRLTTRQTLIFDIKSKGYASISIFLITVSILFIVILFSILFLLVNYCWLIHRKTSKTQSKTNWNNSSPTTPDTHLIDNEYMTTTVTSLPRTSSYEQRIYPTFNVNSDCHYQRRILSHSSLDRINFQYPIERKISLKEDYQQRLSMTDINKYLERFEKLYNDSLSQQYLHQPMGSVV